jgi:predicted ABC-type ATPase
MKQNNKQLYIISGCNGAGKTTASYTVLPEVLHCKEFVNADEIARGLSPFNPDGMAIEAGRLMLKRIDELMGENATFSIETTLSSRSYAQLVHRAHDAGYKVTLIYFWLNSPELAISRVRQRVKEGGHNIPEDVIRRRYVSGIHNLFNIYMTSVDYWLIADNSQKNGRVLIAEGGLHTATNIYDVESYNTIQSYVDR